MVFSSLVFIYVFLAAALVLYFFSTDVKVRNTVLCLLSLAFYAWGEPKWIILLLLGCAADYVLALLIEKNRRDKSRAKLLMILAVIENVAVLGVFKYSGFAVSNLNALFGASLAVPSITLPIGISFFTFQKLSYTIDVYRGDVKAQRSFINFVLYISMFFQLIAGPIVRYSSIESEMSRRRVTAGDFARGLKRFCFGLGKKVFLANVAGGFVDMYLLKDPASLTTGEAWFGITMFALQIYYDFSGYSDMAIGLGRMFGFHFPENFKYPYAARTITEFWRRWHISLSGFFRDYVYIPLGGNRKHQIFNLLVVWALTGLWHGASWNYVLWGLYYCVLLIIEKFVVLKPLANAGKNAGRVFGKTGGRVFTAAVAVVQKCVFIFVTLMGWTLFYFEDSGRLFSFVKTLFGGGSAVPSITLGVVLRQNVWWLVAALALTQPIVKCVKYAALRLQRRYGAVYVCNDLVSSAVSILLFVLSTIALVGNSYNPFLYFRY